MENSNMEMKSFKTYQKNPISSFHTKIKEIKKPSSNFHKNKPCLIVLPLPVLPALMSALCRPAFWAGEVTTGTFLHHTVAQVKVVVCQDPLIVVQNSLAS